ncbi:Golgin subfamily B member 1 [Larimichthys crocea]|uniref:Golgin subfamily B member 1 n=3 Tax=Larimichthys crocea TaxID=215358 RepID=A0A6G0HQH2_LARCR|nr:Golgin subfamily B member 1 [Larimichthys crocea]
MFSRLATVLQELSGEEEPDGDSQQGMLVPQLPPGEGQASVESEVPEEAMERLAHLEQLVVQLKELIRDRDTQLVQKDTELAGKDAQLKNEKEEAEARFTKLKLQAKAKMASLNKQISDLKGQGGATQSPDSSFTGASAAVEEELQELKTKLREVEANSRGLQERLQTTEQLLQEKESVHAEQLLKLQAVICEKDVRFQEQIQKHEEELLRVTTQSQDDGALQQALHAAQRRCEELEEAFNSRSQVLEMLQQEVSSADQQKQILTAQFRQMEQELAEAVKQREEERQQWVEQASRADAELAALRTSLEEALEGKSMEVARQESELASLRESERLSQEALEKEKLEVARLEREVALTKEAELAAVQASHDASERDRAERVQLESELASMREAVEHASRDASEREKSEVDKLERELASLKEEHEDAQKKGEILGEMWRHLRPLALEDVTAAEELPVPADLSLFLDTVESIESRLTRLKESEEHCAELTHTMETLQEQLDRKNTEHEETAAKIQELEQQIVTMSERDDVTEPSSDSSEANKARILELEQHLLEKDSELVALQESLIRAKECSSGEVASDQTPHQGHDASTPPRGSAAALPDFMEDTQDEETTLVAEDASVLSISADNESSPELLGHQSESPEESKATSSDEMVASSDSEVAHSSWTLLEAVSQDGGQEWPSNLQDFGQLQLQSWEATSMEQETSTVQVESSSVIIRETVQVHLTQSSSTTDGNAPSDQAFAQLLAEELQKRYSELLAELQRLRDAAADSQEKIKSLEEDARSLSAAKEEAESQANSFAEELKSTRDELDRLSQQSSSGVEKHSIEMQLLEEQIDILSTESKAKEEKIQAMRADLEMARQAFSEQEGQARMLSVQLEDRELLSSELERRLQDMENSMLEYSQTSELNNDSLARKDSEINELQLRLSQKEHEVMELNDSMSAKLLQAEEEKFQTNSEVSKLKEQIEELEKVKDEKLNVSFDGSAAQVDDELLSLRKAKGVLETQLTNTKKKLQAALVQRKELLKKVADFEMEAKKRKEQDDAAEGEQPRGRDIQEMEAKLVELEQALRSKEEAVEALEQKISQQEQTLTETLALNKTLSEEAESSQQADVSSETTALQSQVTSLEAECETLQRKVQEAQESRKETIRKAKEKDRHHREQLKQQKEEYSDLMERFELQSGEREVLLTKLREMEEKVSTESEAVPHQETKKQLVEDLEKQAAGDWVQEDWVDFAASETDSSQPQSSDPVQHPAEQSDVLSAQMEEALEALRAEIQTVRIANTELEKQLQETQAGLSLKEAELLELGKELQTLREKEAQIDALSEEMNDLREKHRQAEFYAETLKAEMEAAVSAASADSTSAVATLQAEVEDFKQFLDNKNREITELSQQLSEQDSLIHSMQGTVSQKDQLIESLQDELKAEQEKSQRLEVEVPQKQEEEKDSEAKIQQLQRKLQAALISRKDALKENKTQKEQLASTEKLIAELQQKMESAEDELEKLRAERVRLIEEVDRTLLENQSLGSSCESLKLAMDGILNEKDACKRETDLAKEEAARTCREWEEKVQSMKDEYETLLKSYENVSDEAERVRRVLEAARQERQELASRVRTQEAARQEAERQAEEAQKEVDSVKDKMRKFAKTKQQKILDLEEENERLRETQDKTVVKRESRALKAEVERLQDELEALKAELDATAAERDSLGQRFEELRQQSAQTREKEDGVVQDGSAAVVEEVVTAQQSAIIMTKAEPVESQYEDTETPLEETPADQKTAEHEPETHLQPAEAKEVTESVQALLEDKIKEMEAERKLWQEQEAELKSQLASLERDLQESKDKESLVASLEKCLQESKEREKSLIGEDSNREAQFKELLRSLETEKDNLEERLMNQLAQLNGSIAGYQQEAADNREHLVELQREVERLERERAELEAEAQSESDRAARLEEDMRQAQRERAEAEAESGKQRELEQQLRSAQRVREGSQSRARQLEELLREKQLEVRQLQRDCIQYQERISELGREAKALLLGHDELQKKLEQSQLETSKTVEDLKRTEAELMSCKSQLDEAQKQASDALAEKTTIEQNAQKKEASMKAEAEQTLDSVRFRLGAELKEMELRLEDAYSEREKEEEATLEARELAEAAERRAQEMQARLDESLARLAAFSRCMSSLQDDRDRVLDETRQWETRFNDALQGKEAEVREAETRAKDLAEQLQRETTLKEELQLTADRLEKANKDLQLRLEEEEKKVTESQAALEEEKNKLQQTTTELQSAQDEASALKNEVESLHQRTRALEEAVSQLQGEVDRARTELREREAEERRLCLNVEQLETDLRSSKALTESLQTELNEKEKREVEMLGEKEQAVAEAAEEARKEADSRAQGAEEELEQRRGELRDLEEKLRKAEEESNNRKARLDSFMKAMGSLQDDRDRVLNMYKQLEEKHLQVMMEKDGLIQEAAGENNSLKEELRSLLVQRDDLYAEKAKLSAQLHGYREELNQVLSMKESQHKQLLAAQRRRIASLEKQREELESQLKSVNRVQETEVEVEAAKVEKETLSQAANFTAAPQVVDAPGAEVEKLREQLQAAREQVEALEESLQKERHEKKSASKELAELRWEGGVMRTESESAQERVAELARDLLAVEQKLLEEKEATTQLRAENQSFSKAMASLQDNRDQAVNKAQELSLKLEEMSKTGGHAAPSSPGGNTGEVWGLKNALQALQNDRERLLEQLQTQTSELKKQKSELARLGAGELIKVSQELLEEKKKSEDMLGVIVQLESVVEMGKQEIETLRLERIDWMAQAEQLKQQTLATLSDRDQQLRQLTAMLEEARAHKPKLQQEHYQREGTEEVDSAPGAPQERSNQLDSHTYIAELKELQRRLDEEMQQRVVAEEQLMATQDRLKRHSQAKWQEEDQSETAVFIEPPEGAVTRTRRGGPGLMRMLRVAFCSRQRTPLLFSLYLLTVHVLLLLCLGGYL